MARTVIEIKNSITDVFMDNTSIQSVYGLDPERSFEEQFSLASFENIIFDILSFVIWTLETIFDTHKSEVSDMLTELKPHTARWYRNKALAFQYGYDLIEDTDVFDNGNDDDETIASKKIVKYAAVVESETESRLIIKIATEDGNSELSPITAAEQASFEAYMQEIRDAGVKITVANYLPDLLRLQLRIYYDPLVLDANGMSIQNGNYPVQEALQEFMKKLPFNGELVLANLIDQLQQTEGVEVPHLDLAETAWIDPTTSGYGNYETIDVKTIPQAGYFKLQFDGGDENDSTITYIAN